MKRALQFFVYLIFRTFLAILLTVPNVIQIAFVELLIRLVVKCVPRYLIVARTNLKLVFPEKDERWREELIQKSYSRLARTFVDLVRIPFLDRAWFDEHVENEYLSTFERLKKRDPKKGILMITGHFGSFELLPNSLGKYGHGMFFIARSMKNPYIDTWWNKVRKDNVHELIFRQGAFKHMLRALNQGKDVGLLFDQNVRRSQAVFVNWFGKPAATTRAVGLSALRAKANVIMTAAFQLPHDRYRMLGTEYNFESIYNDPSLSDQEKVERITQTLAHGFEDVIRQDPPAWFWFHRRWKTSPDESIPENFYKQERN